MFAGFQAALWNHARAQARSVARDTAALVARQGLPAEQAVASAQAALADAELQRPQVSIDAGGGLVRVTITGDAPGILRGTSSGVSVTTTVGAMRRSRSPVAPGSWTSAASAASSSLRRNAETAPTRTVPKVRATSSTRKRSGCGISVRAARVIVSRTSAEDQPTSKACRIELSVNR